MKELRVGNGRGKYPQTKRQMHREREREERGLGGGNKKRRGGGDRGVKREETVCICG